MKLFLPLFLAISVPAYSQIRYFDLDKADQADIRQFLLSKRVIVVGEMHGTTEVPHFVLNLVKELSSSEGGLAVGLEIPSNYQKDIDEFLKTGDFNKLVGLDYFKHPDGRTSVAMGELIKSLREMKGVKVICFDSDSELSPGINRDSVMGANLHKNYDGGKLVMLTGNLHANLKEGYWRPNFKSAVYYFNKLSQLEGSLISLNTYFGSGTIWNCMQDGCKERETYSNASLKQNSGMVNFVGIYDGVHQSGYSGFVYIDKVTASRPMVE